MMMNWHALSQTKQDRIWSEVNKLIKWKPGSRYHHIIPPEPYRVFDISSGMSSKSGHDDVSEVLSDLETSILKAFQSCTGKNNVMYALDWQHDGYMFSPHQTMPQMNLAIGLFPYFQTETIISFFIRIFLGGFWVIRGNVPSLYLVKSCWRR